MAERIPFSGEQYWNACSQQAYVGAKMYTYEAETRTVLKVTYTTEDEGVSHPNPIIANADGIFPEIYGNGAFYIKILNNAEDSLIYEADNIKAISADITAQVEANTLAISTKFGAVITTIFTVDFPEFNPNENTIAMEWIVTAGGGGAGFLPESLSTQLGASGQSGAGGGTALMNSTIIDSVYAIVVGIGGLAGNTLPSSGKGDDGGESSVASVNSNCQATGGEGGERGEMLIGTHGGNVGFGGEGVNGYLNLRGGDVPPYRNLSSPILDDPIDLPVKYTTVPVLYVSGGSYWGDGVSPTQGVNQSTTSISPGVGGGARWDNGESFERFGSPGSDGVVVLKEYLSEV